jgi:hypothetical protein
VMEGEYEVMNPLGSQIISCSEFANTVEPGAMLEMNIILRKDSRLQANRERCPRPQCRYNNFNVPASHGWIEWKVLLYFAIQIFIDLLLFSQKCFAKFRVGEAGDVCRPRKGENPLGKKRSSVDEIVSPASYVAHFLYVKLSLTIGDIIKS